MTSSLLNIGTRSLAAAQGSLATISHNIANANVAGYSRQETLQATSPGQFTGSGFYGRGVDLTTVRRQYDQFLTASVQTSAAQAGADRMRASALAEMDALFADPELGIGAAMDGLFAAAGDLANRPADQATRQSFVARASQTAQRVTGMGAQLAELGTLAEGRLTQSVTQANQRLTEIRSLNTQIAQGLATGHTPNDLLDQRDVAVQALSSLIGVNVVPVNDGTLSLFTNTGAPLLVGGQQAELQVRSDPADASRMSLRMKVGSVTQGVDASSAGGQIGGIARFRDEDLASAINQVGRLAVVLADRFNAQQAVGVDATGAPGGPLFTVPAPAVRPNSANTGTGGVAVTLADSSRLQASDYRVDYDGAAFTITRLSDGQATSASALPATVDGLSFAAAGPGTPATGDSFLVKPFAAAAVSMAARPLSAQQVATGYAATVQAAAANKGSAAASQFAVVRATADNTLPVSITFNNPPTSYNIVGLAGGNLSNVPYTPGQRIPAVGASPADYNGWAMVIDGTPVAGDSFAVGANRSPATDNRNALSLTSLGSARLLGGATLNETYASLLADAGTRVQGAADAASVSARLQDEAVTRQAAVSGVNLDEEASNLLRYQQAYQASARIIQASQSLFEALMSATGR